MKNLCLLTCLLLILFTSCSVEKRHYRNGFSVEWNKTKPSPVEPSTAAKRTIDDTPAPAKTLPQAQASTPGNPAPHAITAINKSAPRENYSNQKAAEECDLIIYKSGNEEKVKVTEVN